MLAGMLIVPNDDEAADVVRGYRDNVEQAPEQLVTALATVLAPPEPFVPPEMVGTPVLGILGAVGRRPGRGRGGGAAAARADGATAWTWCSRCPTRRSRR